MKLSILVLALLLCIAPASAQKYYLLQTVTGTGGGGQSSSPGYSMGGTIGDQGTGLASSSGYSAEGGFWGENEALRDFYSSSLAVNDGWNLISVGTTVADYRKAVLFPSAASGAFAYQGGYALKDTLRNGKGYWLKFVGSQSVEFIGGPRPTDTISVALGWNLVGAGYGSVPTASVVQIPPGVVTSQYFGYNLGYAPSSSLDPGQGYWVKTNGPGKLVLNVPSALAPVTAHSDVPEEFAGLNQLTVTSLGAAGGSQKLLFGKAASGTVASEAYEMPPMAPKGALDVRFASNQFAEFFSGESKEVPIAIQSNGAPLEISWTMKEESGVRYLLVEKKGEKVIAEHALVSGKKVTLQSTQGHQYSIRVAELPTAFALNQNYPNPFNPTTKIQYELPVDSRVTLKIFDMLGREVSALVDGEMKAGHQSAEWSAAGVASGVYFYRFAARSLEGNQTFSDVRKMMHVK